MAGKDGSKINKQVRMPKWLVDKIRHAAEAEGSTFSQFIRTAAAERLQWKGKA